MRTMIFLNKPVALWPLDIYYTKLIIWPEQAEKNHLMIKINQITVWSKNCAMGILYPSIHPSIL